jgi:DNA processing protein
MSYAIRELPKDEFPASLFEIPQPPKKLFLAGELPPADRILIAVVGSRKHTSYGADACEKIIEGLTGYPIVIVSGLALGIDALAHKSALRAGLKTLAIPGSGIHPKVIYPRTNLSLAEEIVEKGGALLSEYEPEFHATTWSFPARNRIMAGISRAVLVIEADERSGTLITARLATEYNRDVYVVPNGIFSPGSRGSNKLLKQGAYPITSADDILELLSLKDTSISFQEKPPFNLSPEEQKIFDLLAEPMSRDDLIRGGNLGTQDTGTLLSVMEIKGIIIERGGDFRRT